jgi:hypothetical protein
MADFDGSSKYCTTGLLFSAHNITYVYIPRSFITLNSNNECITFYNINLCQVMMDFDLGNLLGSVGLFKLINLADFNTCQLCKQV